MNSRQELGSSGEAAAVEFLKRRGFGIVDQNFRCRQGEVDVIALEGDTVCFIEVKARRSLCYGSGLEAVYRQKQRKIVSAAAYYLQVRGWEERPVRFDVISIFIGPGNVPAIEHVPGAFESDG